MEKTKRKERNDFFIGFKISGAFLIVATVFLILFFIIYLDALYRGFKRGFVMLMLDLTPKQRQVLAILARQRISFGEETTAFFDSDSWQIASQIEEKRFLAEKLTEDCRQAGISEWRLRLIS